MRSIERRRRHQQTKAIIGGCIISIFFVCVSFNQLNLDKKIGSATSLRLEVKETKNTTLVSPYDCQTPRNKDDSSSILDYNYLVNCTWLKDQLGLARFVLVVMLIVLLYLLSSTADAFFCPSLQAIVEKYRVPPDIAGVTFLSFGNGSPDVFSNIAAFSSSTPKIGVTSILGGGLLVTTVIAASVGLASQGQHQLIPRKYVRDIFFYFIGVCYFCYAFFDGLVDLLEAFGFLLIYLCFVTVVLIDKYIVTVFHSKQQESERFFQQNTMYQTLPLYQYSSGSESSYADLEEYPTLMETPPMTPTTYEVFQIPSKSLIGSSSSSVVSRASSTDLSDTNGPLAQPRLYRKSSAPTPRSRAENFSFFRDSFGAGKVGRHRDSVKSTVKGERLSLLERTDSLMKRPASVCVSNMRRRHSTWQTLQNSSHFGPTARRWTRTYHLGGIEEFPSVSEIGEDAEEMEEGLEELEEYKPENIWVKRFKQGMEYFEEYIWLPFETLTTLIRRLTIPLVDEETWDKNFAFLCPPFAILMIGLTIFHVSIMNVWLLIIVALGGSAGSAFVAFTSEPDLPPQGILLAPYLVLAFVMSVIWIMNIANEVLALLETLGNLFGISDSVLGVSVLAWGNSIGDLVSNTAIARDGFPTMAFAGCFAGPMFNLLVGIGASLTIATIKRGPVHVGKPSPLVFLGFGYLYMSLFINFIFAAKNGFSYSKKLCYGLLLLYASFTIASIILVLQTDQKDEA